ncbi:MAG: M3 family metallopeptidase [Candidatus Krumholzibacteria bacterium]|nr:M3 family metallopeptidase [Candidatus Krumholzibacteria bacterium]
MRKPFLFLLALALPAILCSFAPPADNPLLGEFTAPFGAPPFDKIRIEHYKPAYLEGMRQQREAIAGIAGNAEAPTFANTIEALEASGDLLTRVDNIFRSMSSANTSDELQEIAKEIAPVQSAHYDEILFNEKLFARIKAVYDKRDKLDLNQEQKRLLEKTYRAFVRGGANLSAGDKAKLAEINQELSVLGLQFEENLLEETNKFVLIIDNKADLAGLPEGVVTAAAEAARQLGHEGKWVFTVHKPSMIPFLQYSERRDLREKLYKAYITRGDHNDGLDNKKTLLRIVDLRIKRAQLLGYKTHADFALEESMAKKSAAVYDFLGKLWTPAIARAKNEAASFQQMIDKEGKGFKLASWDWWYYAEKVRKAQYDLDDEMLRPYFELENVRAGAFMLATKLFGITFEERKDIPTYNDEVRVYEVKEASGKHIGLLYADYYPRDNKQGGAWCGGFRSASRIGGKIETPLVTNCGNFVRPAGDTPSLLNFDEVTTMFHEFGHGLHSLLTEVSYPTVQNVATDFVELPSQIMENWATDPEFMKMYARHYQTGAPIPDELIRKIRESSTFNQGFMTTEYLAASILDMDWHTLAEPPAPDANAFEIASLGRIGLIPEIISRYRSTYFAHIFGDGGYAAGYYSYIWAEVLDADAFKAFKETSLFDQKTASAYRKYILAAGGIEDEMTLYKKFRGREPAIGPLLERRGLN